MHQGILLGTGPIVDPELVANLLIPLHNFSNQTIEIEYNKKIISVEFTKTLNPEASIEIDGYKFCYKKNESRVFDFDKYRQRISDKKIESSVSSTFEKYDKSISSYKNRLSTFTWSSAIAILAAYIGLVTLVITTYMFISSARNEVNEAKNTVATFKEELLRDKNSSLDAAYVEIQNQLKELRQVTENINKNIINDEHETEITQLLDRFDRRIKKIESNLLIIGKAQK